MENICNVMLKKLIDENNAKTAQVHLQVLLTTLHRMNITHSSTTVTDHQLVFLNG